MGTKLPLKLNLKELTDFTLMNSPPTVKEVSEIILSKFLGENIYNLLIYGAILLDNCFFMHQFSDVVHLDINVFGSLSLNHIC